MFTAPHIHRALAALLLGFTLALAPLAARAEPLTILLDWFINPDHGPLIVALEKGYFAQAGLEVTLVEPADPSAPPKLVAAGQAALAVSYQPQLHLLAAEGLPLTRVGTRWQPRSTRCSRSTAARSIRSPISRAAGSASRSAASSTTTSRPCWRATISPSTT